MKFEKFADAQIISGQNWNKMLKCAEGNCSEEMFVLNRKEIHNSRRNFVETWRGNFKELWTQPAMKCIPWSSNARQMAYNWNNSFSFEGLDCRVISTVLLCGPHTRNILIILYNDQQMNNYFTNYSMPDCIPLSTGILYGRLQRVTIPDAVIIQFVLLKMSKVLLETCWGL